FRPRRALCPGHQSDHEQGLGRHRRAARRESCRGGCAGDCAEARGGEAHRCSPGAGTAMRGIVRVIVIALLVYAVSARIQRGSIRESSEAKPSPAGTAWVSPTPAGPQPFACDGRRFCSQMTSCAEAKYFLNHCPDTSMDGDHDGIPCERQWCTTEAIDST